MARNERVPSMQDAPEMRVRRSVNYVTGALTRFSLSQQQYVLFMQTQFSRSTTIAAPDIATAAFTATLTPVVVFIISTPASSWMCLVDFSGKFALRTPSDSPEYMEPACLQCLQLLL